MPTVLVIYGFRFVIYFNDHSPPHIHVLRDACELVVEIKTVRIVRNIGNGFSLAQVTKILMLIKKNEDFFEEKWREFHEKEDN